MSHRTKKTTTTTTSSKIGSSGSHSAFSTPVSSSTTSAHADHSKSAGRAGARSPSPSVISRLQEKNDLASLNDRLASYIDRVRQLEGENSRLTRMVQTQEDVVTKEVSGIKGLYEGELASARRMLDDLAKEKAKLQVEVGKMKSEIEDLREKFVT